MEIQQVEPGDIEAVERLITDVSEQDVLPEFSEQGRAEYKSRVLSDIVTAFNARRFYTLKLVSLDGIVGFGALRDGNYLTHLFISNRFQRSGAGKLLLDALLQSTNAEEVNLRSSVNAVSFYQTCGFEVTNNEMEFNGIRFVPMRLLRS